MSLKKLQPRQRTVPIEEMTLHDFFVAFALIGASAMRTPEGAAKWAMETADAVLDERAARDAE